MSSNDPNESVERTSDRENLYNILFLLQQQQSLAATATNPQLHLPFPFSQRRDGALQSGSIAVAQSLGLLPAIPSEPSLALVQEFPLHTNELSLYASASAPFATNQQPSNESFVSSILDNDRQLEHIQQRQHQLLLQSFMINQQLLVQNELNRLDSRAVGNDGLFGTAAALPNNLLHSTSSPDKDKACHANDSSSTEDDAKPPAVSQQNEIAAMKKLQHTAVNFQDYRFRMEHDIRNLPQGLTAAYYEALQMAPPKLWENECNPDLFLLVEGLHTQRAGIRIAKYWQMRNECYGDRKHDSLTQTGEDALDRKDLVVLGTGFLTLLPNDAHGRSVLCIDAARLERGMLTEVTDRCMFYMFSLMAENRISQEEGAVILYKMESTPFHTVKPAFLERLISSLPLRIKALHILSHIIFPTEITSKITISDVFVHVGPSKDAFPSKLQHFGMSRDGLPTCFGGEWGYEKFVLWQELRTRYEWKIPVGLSGRASSDASDFPAIKQYAVQGDRAEIKRRLNVIHTRRKRDRERIEFGVLQERCTELREEQQKLVAENRMLEEALRVATTIVQRVETKKMANSDLVQEMFGRSYTSEVSALGGMAEMFRVSLQHESAHSTTSNSPSVLHYETLQGHPRPFNSLLASSVRTSDSIPQISRPGAITMDMTHHPSSFQPDTSLSPFAAMPPQNQVEQSLHNANARIGSDELELFLLGRLMSSGGTCPFPPESNSEHDQK